MKVTVDSSATSPEGLVVGAILEYTPAGPIRFAKIVIPWSVIGPQVRAELVKYFDRLIAEDVDQDGLWESQTELG